MATITGTASSDTLTGTVDADLMQGLDGPDTLAGGAGDDTLEGGDGGDQLYGELGSDKLFGGADADSLSDSLGGNDELFGESGADYLWVSRAGGQAVGSVLMDGGASADTLSFYGYGRTDQVTMAGGDGADSITATDGRTAISGGAGADTVSVTAYHPTTTAVIDAGADDDRVSLSMGGGAYTVTLGSGSDLLTLNNSGYGAGAALTLTDFETGDAGDRLGLVNYLSGALTGWDGSNPFASGHLRLVQSGADALLQIDRNGGGDGFTTLLTLQNTTAANLTATNLGGYASDGSTPAGQTIAGTTGSDTLAGSAGADLIRGLDGADTLHGGAGADTLEGGEGNDQLNGELGSDKLFGGADSDSLSDSLGGDDELYGESGSDNLSVNRSGAQTASRVLLDGGASADTLSFYGYNRIDQVTMAGGDGADSITATDGRTTISGGAGADTISITAYHSTTTSVIDAGGDADRVFLSMGNAAYTVALGSGSDLLTLSSGYGTTGSLTVTDFEAGDAGDQLGLLNYLSASLTGWDGSNPFGSGHLRLLQNGADALLQMDRNGGGDGFFTLLTFQNTTAANLTATNLGGYASDGSTPAGQTITGTASSEALSGAAGADRVQGLDGYDTLAGGAGDDTLEGGEGSDQLNGELGSDKLFGGAESDSLSDSLGGNDELFGESGGDHLSVHRSGSQAVSTVLMDGGASADTLSFYGYGRTDQVTMAGGDGADSIASTDGRTTISGGAGADTINITAYHSTTMSVIDAGGDDDRVSLSMGGGAYTVTLGSGSDLLTLSNSGYGSGASLTVTDFEAGNSGDRLGLQTYLSATLTGWDGSNPFASGHLRLVQSGADALLQIDRNGGGDGFSTLLTLQNTMAANLTATNLGGYEAGTRRTLFGSEGGDALVGGSDADVLEGRGGADTLTGGLGDDALLGGAGEDRLEGGGGRDRLIGGSGADRLIGGAGDDVYELTDDGDVVTELANGGVDVVFSYLRVTALDPQVEVLSLEGAAMLGIGNGLDNVMYGTGAANILIGGAGADVMTGGLGDDAYEVTEAGDRVIEAAGGGSDVVFSYVSGYVLPDNVEVLSLEGGAVVGVGNGGDNVLFGTLGANVLIGRGGSDLMIGGRGDDVYEVTEGGDHVVEAADAGVDVVFSYLSGYKLTANVEVLSLQGSAVVGIGNTLNNTLIGTDGGNALNGEAGDDRLIGGGGSDSFWFLGSDAGHDRIADFDPLMDVVVLDRAFFADFASVQARWSQDGGNVVIRVDADTTLTLENVQLGQLTANDFGFY